MKKGEIKRKESKEPIVFKKINWSWTIKIKTYKNAHPFVRENKGLQIMRRAILYITINQSHSEFSECSEYVSERCPIPANQIFFFLEDKNEWEMLVSYNV